MFPSIYETNEFRFGKRRKNNNERHRKRNENKAISVYGNIRLIKTRLYLAAWKISAEKKAKQHITANNERKKNKTNEQNGCCFSFSCSSKMALVSYEYVNTRKPAAQNECKLNITKS